MENITPKTTTTPLERESFAPATAKCKLCFCVSASPTQETQMYAKKPESETIRQHIKALELEAKDLELEKFERGLVDRLFYTLSNIANNFDLVPKQSISPENRAKVQTNSQSWFV